MHELVKRKGAKLSIDSIVGEGSTFRYHDPRFCQLTYRQCSIFRPTSRNVGIIGYSSHYRMRTLVLSPGSTGLWIEFGLLGFENVGTVHMDPTVEMVREDR